MGMKYKPYSKVTQSLLFAILRLPVITTIVLAYLKAHDKVNCSVLTVLLPVIIPAGLGIIIILVSIIYVIKNRKNIVTKGNNIIPDNGEPNA